MSRDKQITNMAKPPALPRITTGNSQLDEILGGGFPANSINILMGEPGSGKTILAEQLLFANAQKGDRPILFLTTLSEPLEKVIRYLQQFTFYDDLKLSECMIYDSLGPELTEKGSGAVVPKLKEAILSLSPKIIVIDSFKAIHDPTASVPEMRKMLYDLAGLLTAYDTTVFLIGEYSPDQIAVFPEFAIADGMVELDRLRYGTRDERYLRVLKLRGSEYAEGLHAFRITQEGLEVFPRLVSPKEPPSYESLTGQITTGIKGIDTMLGGGLCRGSTTILEGPSGSGKTTFGLQFALEGIRHEEPSLYINFQENPTQLMRAFTNLGANIEAAKGKGLHLLYRSAVELQIDSIMIEIYRAIQEKKIRRLVVDALGDVIATANDTQRLHSYLYSLVQHFVVGGVTTILTYETTSQNRIDTQFSAICDNVIRLDVEPGKETKRTVRVAKARGLAHELGTREFRITNRGIEIV